MDLNPERLAILDRERINIGTRNLNPMERPVHLGDAFKDKSSTGAGSIQFDQVGKLETVQDYVNDTADDNLAFGLAVLAAETSTTPLEAADAVLSILRQCWVNLRPSIERFATRAGIKLLTIYVPSQADAYCLPLDLVKQYSRPEMITISGYLIMLLFKNITSVSYDQFFHKIMTAMRAIAGVSPDSDIAPLFNVEKAGSVRQILGANNILCKAIIECLMEERTRDAEYSRFCDYILDIVSWTGMSAYRWVFECLMLNDSPIFFSNVVRVEVLALNEVITAMARCRYPALFPYFGSPDDVSKLKRARFPIILSVARVLKQRTSSPTATNFVLLVIRDQMRLIEELADAHQLTLARKRETRTMKESMEMLCGPNYSGTNNVPVLEHIHVNTRHLSCYS